MTGGSCSTGSVITNLICSFYMLICVTAAHGFGLPPGKSCNSQILNLYAANVSPFCSWFAAHLQFKRLFDRTGLQQNVLSQAYSVRKRHTHVKMCDFYTYPQVTATLLTFMCGLILPLLLLWVTAKCCVRSTAGGLMRNSYQSLTRPLKAASHVPTSTALFCWNRHMPLISQFVYHRTAPIWPRGLGARTHQTQTFKPKINLFELFDW